MELKNVVWEDGSPQEATFSMTVREAAMISSLFGKFSPRMIAEFFGDPFVESFEEMTSGLWDFFVRHYDDGYNDVLHHATRNMGLSIRNSDDKFFHQREQRWMTMVEVAPPDDTIRPGD